MNKETRVIQSKMEIRQDGDKRKITGYGARFNELSDVLFFFREKIAPGAFRKALEKSDVRALFNHNPDIVLGRNKSGTLKLQEDEMGLRYEIDPPSWAGQYIEMIERGDVNQSSFAFTVSPEAEEWDESGDIPVRTIHEFDEIFDVSPVTYPAYPSTSSGVRSDILKVGLDIPALNSLIFRAQRGMQLKKADHDLIKASIDKLNSFIEPDGAKGSNELLFRKKHLELLEKECI